MKCVVWEAKGGYSSVGEEEEGRSSRGSCFAGHRSQQPAASYITCLPPIIIITVKFNTIFNNIVIINVPILLYLLSSSASSTRSLLLIPLNGMGTDSFTGQQPPVCFCFSHSDLLSNTQCFLHIFLVARYVWAPRGSKPAHGLLSYEP